MDEMIKFASKKTGLDIKPMFAMSYRRSHYVINGKNDIRITIDNNIAFHRIVKDKLEEFHKVDRPLIEIKLNPNSKEAIKIKKDILDSLDHKETVSKKITMYKIYEDKFLK
jgi:hypothetical protein